MGGGDAAGRATRLRRGRGLRAAHRRIRHARHRRNSPPRSDAYASRYLPQRVCLRSRCRSSSSPRRRSCHWVSAAIVAVTPPLAPALHGARGATTRDRTQHQCRRCNASGTISSTSSPGCDAEGVRPREGAERDRRRRDRSLPPLAAAHAAALVPVGARARAARDAVGRAGRGRSRAAALGGSLDLRTALFVLVLAPEAYLPLRELGANYHAGAEGAAVARRVFEVLDRPRAARGHASVPASARSSRSTS